MMFLHRGPLAEDARLSRDLVKRVWRFARPYRWKIAAFLGVVAVSSVIGVAPPLLFRELIDDAIPNRSFAAVNLVAFGAVLVALSGGALSLLQRWLSSKVGEGLIYDLRTALFDHVQRQPLLFFTHTQTGALSSRLNTDVVGAQRALTGTLGAVTSNLIGLVSTLVVMTVLNWWLTLVSVAVLPLFGLPARRVGRRLRELTREAMTLNASMNTVMNERFQVAGALLVILFGRRDRELDEFSGKAGRVRDIGVRTALYGGAFMVALGLVGTIGTAVVYWWGSRLVLSGALTIGTVVAFAAYLTRLYDPLIALIGARVDILTAFVSFERVFEVLDHESKIGDSPSAMPLENAAGRIEFEDVHFTYPSAVDSSIPSLMAAAASETEAGPVLSGVSFIAEPGRLVALVGPSGAGKTTIAMLVPRIYDVTSGSVRVDGIDVRDLKLESLRRFVGVVTQDPHLFHDTIAANLRYARPDATDGEIGQACRAARLADLIESLPERYETVVGDRGYRLSGGEKQRLAIARLLLAEPVIVILDEATAHLDSESEVRIQEAFADALVGRTSLVIAHRLSTIVRADLILVVDEGRIVERGTHADLLAAGGLYADLYRTQFGRALVG